MVIYKPIILQLVSLTILFFYILFSSLKSYKFLKKISLVFLLTLILSLIFVSRDYDEVTIDLSNYMYYYTTTINFSDIFNSVVAWKGDHFFFAMMPIAHFFELDPYQYISFQTTISITLLIFALYRFFYDSKSLVFLALFFIVNSSNFYFTNGNVLRQGFASSILLFALTTKSSKSYFYTKMIALFTHRGSLFSLFSSFSPKSKNLRIIILLFALTIGFFGIHFQVLSKLPLSHFLVDKLEFYSKFQRASTNSLIKLFLLLCFNIFFLKYFNQNSSLKYRRAYNLYFIFSVVALLLFKLDGAFSRMILFSDIFLPLIIINIISDIKNKKLQLAALITSVFISLFYSFYVFNHSSILFNIGEEYQIFS